MKQSRRPFRRPLKMAEKKCPYCTFCANNKAVFDMHLKNLHDKFYEDSKKIAGDVINEDIDNKSDDDEPFSGFVGSEITEIVSIPDMEEFKHYDFDLTAPFPSDMNNCVGWFDGPMPEYSVKSIKERKSIGSEQEYSNSVKTEEQILVPKQEKISIEDCQSSVKSDEQIIVVKQENKPMDIDECDFYGFSENEIRASTSNYTLIPIEDIEEFDNYEFDLNVPFSSNMSNCTGWFDGTIPEYIVRPNPEEKSSEIFVNPREKSLEKSFKPIPKESYQENERGDEDFHGFTDDEIRLTTTIIPIDDEKLFENDQFDLTTPFPPDMNNCSGWHEEMPFKLI